LSVYRVLQRIEVAIPVYLGAGRPLGGIPTGPGLLAIPDEGTTTTNLLLEGVKAQYIPNTNPPERIPPFTLQYEKGRTLYRATIDLTVVPDDNMSVQLDGSNVDVIRLVASAMPRLEAY
jgi:hypothetical protein